MAVERLFKDEATEEKGERARMASFIGGIAIADLVKTTLGPKGMDKILQSTGRGHSVTVTNDGATILKSLHIDNPAAKVLVDISKVQDDEVGDGTTSVVVLAGELLREAEKLVATKIHPMTIIAVLDADKMAVRIRRSSNSFETGNGYGVGHVTNFKGRYTVAQAIPPPYKGRHLVEAPYLEEPKRYCKHKHQLGSTAVVCFLPPQYEAQESHKNLTRMRQDLGLVQHRNTLGYFIGEGGRSP